MDFLCTLDCSLIHSLPKEKWRRSVAIGGGAVQWLVYCTLYTACTLYSRSERYQVVALRPVSSDGGGAGATSVDATTDTRLQKSLARIGTESWLGVGGLPFYHTQ